MTFRIKICGITSVDDALATANAGADAIGLNFYKGSVRYVDPKIAGSISLGCSPQMRVRAGVFVNMPPDEIQHIVSSVGITAIQLHGDEAPEVVAKIALTKQPPDFVRSPMLIRARRMGISGVAEIASDLRACIAAGARPAAVLVDAATPGRYGGTGETVSWAGLADYKRWLGETPLILAGGLTPDNVAEAIRIVRPDAVDVASGVESAPGKKDPIKMRDFIATAQAAFSA